jgi:hypothetical protein
MKRRTKIALGLAGSVAALGLAGIGLVATALSDMCENRLVAEYPSPGARSKLVVFERDCGATSASSTQASLVAASAPLPTGSANVFVADAAHGAAPSGAGGGPALHVRWEGPAVVVLGHDEKTRVFKSERHVTGVDVRYEVLP